MIVIVLNAFAVGGWVSPVVAEQVLRLFPTADLCVVGDKVKPAFRVPIVKTWASAGEMVSHYGDAKYIFTPGDIDAYEPS